MSFQITLPATNKVSRSLSDLRSLEDVGHERFLDSDECPLINLARRSPDFNGEIIYAVRKRRHRFYDPQAQQCSSAVLHPRQDTESSNSALLPANHTNSAYANPMHFSDSSKPNRVLTQPATSPYLVALSGTFCSLTF